MKIDIQPAFLKAISWSSISLPVSLQITPGSLQITTGLQPPCSSLRQGPFSGVLQHYLRRRKQLYYFVLIFSILLRLMSFLLFLYALCIELYIQLCFIDTVFLLDIKSRTVEEALSPKFLYCKNVIPVFLYFTRLKLLASFPF